MSTVFGLPTQLEADRYRQLRLNLRDLWSQQVKATPKAVNQGTSEDLRLDELVFQLQQMKYWFDPVASGRRLRDAISNAPQIDASKFSDAPLAVMTVGEDRVIMTLEGRALLWVLDRSTLDWPSPTGQADLRVVVLSAADVFEAMACVHDVYRRWVQKKLMSVDDLMQAETSTLRPTAAGLLFFLLLNRHTSRDRALPIPSSIAHSEAISAAISGPVISFARRMSGSEKASEKGVTLYRGWALGEIRRRLGAGLHDENEAVWIDESAIPRALERLGDSFDSARAHSNLESAVSAALDSYEESRSRLAALGIAFERPSNTSRLIHDLGSRSQEGDGRR